jgi:phage terminase large subunit-like protein
MIALTEWAEKFIVLPSGERIKFEPHQTAILDHCFTFDEDGLLPYTTIIYSAPKKSGKTAVNGIVMAWWAYEVEAPNEIITVANKKDQAVARSFGECKGYSRANPTLQAELVSSTGSQITLKNGSTVLAIPNNYEGEAGSNHGLTTWDELWGFTTERDRRLCEVLCPVPTKKKVYQHLRGL